jgi:hypothetical protein
MKYVELYENYSVESKNLIENIISAVINFMNDAKNYKEFNAYKRFINGLSNTFIWSADGNSDSLENIISYLSSNKYDFKTYPVLSEYDLKLLAMQNKLNFSDSIGWDYGPCIVIKSGKMEMCIYIAPKFGSVRFYLLNDSPLLIKAAHATPDEIDCIFWNGNEIVDAEFNVTETYPDDDEKTISHSDYESIKTSDGKKYDANGIFVPLYTEGADGVMLDELIITKKIKC